jgi:tetratricopeptide (TPR) repeat protein
MTSVPSRNLDHTPAPPGAPIPKPVLHLIGALVLTVACVITYGPSLKGQFLWDDANHVRTHETQHDGIALQRIWGAFTDGQTPQYYPLTYTTFWIEARVFGDNPRGYRIVNLALHIGASLLVWMALMRLRVPGSYLCALIFAVHPVNVESVAWITERKNTLSAVFFFASVIVYLRYCGIDPAPPLREGQNPPLFALPADRQRVYLIALLLFTLAMLSKGVAATMPATVLLLIWWKRARITMQDLVPLIPFFAIGLLLVSIQGYMERTYVGATGREFWFSGGTLAQEIAHRSVIAGQAVWFYTYKLLLPMNLMFIYPRWEFSTSEVWRFAFPLAAILVVGIAFLLRNRIGRGPVVALLYFGGSLVPAMGFFPVWPMRYSFVADHFCYLASIGLICLVVGSLATLLAKAASKQQVNPAVPQALGAVVVLILVWASALHARVFVDSKTIWEDILNKTGAIVENPDGSRSRRVTHWMAANMYGLELRLEAAALRADARRTPDRAQRAEFEEGARTRLFAAEQYFKRSLALNPRNYEAVFNLGLLAEADGKSTEALSLYQRSVEIARNELDRDYADGYYRIGLVLYGLGRVDDPIAAFTRVTEIFPRHSQAFHRLGLVHYYRAEARRTEALNLLQASITAIATQPAVAATMAVDDSGSSTTLASTLPTTRPLSPEDEKRFDDLMNAAREDWEASIEFFIKSYNIDWTFQEARLFLCRSLVRVGRWQDAIREWADVARMDPNNVVLRIDFGDFLLANDRPAEAAGQYREAIQIQPRLPDAWFGLAQSELRQARFVEGIEALRNAIALAPNRDSYRALLNIAETEAAKRGISIPEPATRRAVPALR